MLQEKSVQPKFGKLLCDVLTKDAVPDHRPPHHPGPHPRLPGDVGHHQAGQVVGDGVGPGQLAVLLPPSLYHQGHVEAQQESDGDSCLSMVSHYPGNCIIMEI